MTNATKEQILENLIQPLEGVFGEFREGMIIFLLKECQKYKLDILQKTADEIIRTLEKQPYPATILKVLLEQKSKSNREFI